MEAEKICRFLMSRLRVPAAKRDDWGQSPLLCRYFVEKLDMSVHQADKSGDTPLFYAMEAKKTDTATGWHFVRPLNAPCGPTDVIYLLRQGASLGVNNKSFESPESIAPVEVARELQARMKEWAEPVKAPAPEQSGDSKKRKREDEEEVEEPGSAAEGPRALQDWVAQPAKLPKNWRTQLAREKLRREPAVLAENTKHKVTLVTTDALEEVRGLEKMLVGDQAALFKKKLFVRSCRAADFCLALGAYEKDCQFFREYSYIVANRGKVGSLVLVARDKETEQIVGFLHADKGEKELLIGHLKVHNDHQGKGVGKLLIQAAETQALRAGWAFESVVLRVLYLNSRAQQTFFRLGFDICDEPAPETTMSMLSMCLKMVRRAKHAPEAPSESELYPPVAPYVQTAFAPWHLKPADKPKTEEPKAEEPKAEEPKAAGEPKAEEPKAAEGPKVEEPKAEEPKPAEEPKAAEQPKAEEPKAEEPQAAEEPKAAEQPKAEEPKAEEPKAEEPKAAEEPKVEEPKAEEPKAEEPKAEEPKAAAEPTQPAPDTDDESATHPSMPDLIPVTPYWLDSPPGSQAVLRARACR
ncbi:zmpB [Symbiodinium sp. KB8]|nr:zmpB [Symbiodinium sp. KB8]